MQTTSMDNRAEARSPYYWTANPLRRPSVSFEFFPPKTPALEAKLWETLSILAPLNPSFVSVTYGAGGKTREQTRQAVERIHAILRIPTAAHLTSVAASREQVNAIAQSYQEMGISHIVALRGDPPNHMGGVYRPHAEEYANAAEMVAGLRRFFTGTISVAAYPEGHAESLGFEEDIRYLKQKVEAGANQIITQFFFDNNKFLRFRDAVTNAGITVPVYPGIWPIADFATTKKIASQCGATIPSGLAELFEGTQPTPDLAEHVAVRVGVQQCEELVSEGVEHLHFYTLNRAPLIRTICHFLGVRAGTENASVTH